MNFDHDLGKIDSFLTIDTTESPPLGGLTNVLTVLGTGGIILPYGTTAQQPPANIGAFRFNTDINTLEYNDGVIWNRAGGSLTSVAIASDSTTSSALTVVSGSPITTSGTIHLALSAELVGLAGLSTTGLLVRTGSGTYNEATITGTAGNITVTNGNAVAGNPTINLATVSQGNTGTSFVKVNLDTFGRVIDNTAVVIGDLTGVLGTYYLPETGGTVSGNIVMSGGATITGVPSPVGGTDVANKAYVDAAAASLQVHPAVQAATTGNLTAAYANGTTDASGGLGIGATLTNTGAQAALVIDGVSLVLNDRVLVKDQTTQLQNGIYYVTTVGNGSTNWVLTRATDANDSTAGQLAPGDFVFVESGSLNQATGWVETAHGTFIDGNINIGTDVVQYTQFSGAGTYHGTTNQIDLSGNVFSLSSTLITPGAFTASPSNANVTLSPTGSGYVTINPATTGSINNMSIGASTPSTGAFTTLSATGAVTLDPANNSVFISPTGSGYVTINPSTLGTIDNMTIGGVTPAAGTFTTVTSTVSTGTPPFTVTSTTPVTNLSIGGNAATSTDTSNVNVTAVSTNAAYYPAFVSATSGYQPVDVGTGLTFNPSTNNLTTTTFTGALVGNANTATNATNAANVGITLSSANSTFYPTFVSGTSGNLPNEVSSGLSFNPNTNNLTATTFTGALVGNSASATNATNVGVTAVSVNALYYPLFVSASSGYLPSDVSLGLTFNPSTNTMFATNVNVSGQLTSTVVTGTAPLVVASTTQVLNLNSSLLEGKTWEIPGTIGSTTPNSAVFTTLQANSTVTLSPASANVTISPTGTGTVTIDPVGGLTINPTTLGSMDNVTIGGTTPAAGTFTALSSNTSVDFSHGDFTNPGDARMAHYVLRNITSNNTSTELFLDGTAATTPVILSNNSVYTFSILISARRTDATGGGAGWKVEGVMRKDATSASTTLIGSTATTILGRTNNNWNVAVTADTTNGSIKISVTGENSKTIRWVASMTTSEVTN